MLASFGKTAMLVEEQESPPPATATTCSKCRQRIAVVPQHHHQQHQHHHRPINLFGSPNSFFRQQHNKTTIARGGVVCSCHTPKPIIVSDQQPPPQSAASPTQVHLIDDAGLEEVEVALKLGTFHDSDEPCEDWKTECSGPSIPTTLSSMKPIAGSTTVHMQENLDLNSSTTTTTRVAGDTGIQWQRPSLCRNLAPIRVRSQSYRQNKAKQPSSSELYQCVAVDFVHASRRIGNMSSRVQMPNVVFNDETDDFIKTWHAPDVFVVTLSLPAKAGRNNSKKNAGSGDNQRRHSSHETSSQSTAAAAEDGEGYTISMYYTMTPETRAILRQVTSPSYNDHSSNTNHKSATTTAAPSTNAVKLLEQWCRKSPTDPKFQGRFKLIPYIHNPKQVGLPQWMGAYNAKPLLIKRSGKTGILHSQPPSSNTTCLEFEVNFHPFPFLARQALQHLMEHSFDKLQVTLAFVIEGRTEDELPECVLGQTYFAHPHIKSAARAETLFSS